MSLRTASVALSWLLSIARACCVRVLVEQQVALHILSGAAASSRLLEVGFSTWLLSTHAMLGEKYVRIVVRIPSILWIWNSATMPLLESFVVALSSKNRDVF